MFEMSNIHRMFIFWNEIPKKTLKLSSFNHNLLEVVYYLPKRMGIKKINDRIITTFPLIGCLPKGPYSYLHWH